MFKQDDYIVILKGKFGSSLSFPLNFCYKQKNDRDYLSVYKDSQLLLNGWEIHKFDKSKDNDWRYATPQEIEEYNRLNRPFDITTLPQEPQYEIY